MSRIGKIPVPVPAGVDVTIDGSLVTVKGLSCWPNVPDYSQLDPAQVVEQHLRIPVCAEPFGGVLPQITQQPVVDRITRDRRHLRAHAASIVGGEA